MHARRRCRVLIVIPAALLSWGLTTSTAGANHSWGNLHWARTSNPFTLKLGDNVSSNWDSHLRTASADWSKSTVLDTAVVAGSTRPRTCKPTAGRVEVCNATYGSTTWLGVASAWSSGGHITQATVKMNDTHFNTARYNTPAWRLSVMCQEIGHTLGLHHQDENFNNANLGTCMDYGNDPTSNQHPNAHDYDQLETIYNHADGTTTVGAATSAAAAAETARHDDWGRAIRTDSAGRPILFVDDLGNGRTVHRFVIWA